MRSNEGYASIENHASGREHLWAAREDKILAPRLVGAEGRWCGAAGLAQGGQGDSASGLSAGRVVIDDGNGQLAEVVAEDATLAGLRRDGGG